MITTETIDYSAEANLCWMELRQRLEFGSEAGASDHALESDARFQLKQYLQEAIEYMGTLPCGYNPMYHALPLSKRAAREFAKAIFLGREPTTDSGYMMAEQAWRRAAAIDHDKVPYQ